jgi:hypothetical protein
MKQLILIQNDYSGAGKSTLSACLHRYLENVRIRHHRFTISESGESEDGTPCLESSDLRLKEFIGQLDRCDLVIGEIATGAADAFHNFYSRHEMENVLSEMGFHLTVALPVTSDRESFAGVVEAAEVYSDSAMYLIVHTPTGSSYDEDEHFWERSRAARVMDMFEAVDLKMPACQESLEFRLKVSHADLVEVLRQTEELQQETREEITKWMRGVTNQLNHVRTYLFGDTFRPAIRIPQHTASPARRTRKAKSTAAAAPATPAAAA